MADNWVQIDIYSKLFLVIGFKLFKAALPMLQQKRSVPSSFSVEQFLTHLVKTFTADLSST